MGQLKASEVGRYLSNPNFQTPVHLVYGPDRGLVAERCKQLASQAGVDLADPFSTIILDDGALTSEPDRMVNEAYTVPMFGGRRLIWARNVGNEASFANQLATLLSDPPESCLLVLQAHDLRKGSKTRELVEKSKMGLALPCFADNSRDVGSIIDEALKANNLAIGLEARQILMDQLGGDRMASRSEVEKLCLYMSGHHEITTEHVQQILGDASAVNLDAIVDAVLSGNVNTFDRATAKFIASGGSPQQLFSAMIRQFQMLDRMRSEMETSGKGADSVINSARPPVFFSRKPSVKSALNSWSARALRAAQERLQSALLDSRKNSSLVYPITHMSLFGLTVQSARRK